MSYASVSHWEDSEFLSLFRSRFLLPSLLFHGLVGLLAWQAASLVVPKSPNDAPISVQLLEVRSGSSINKSIGPAEGPGGPKTMPKLGLPVPPRQQTGKIDSGSVESTAPSAAKIEAPAEPKPIPLPGPKVLATDMRHDAVNVKETSTDSLVRLPTKETATNLPGSSATDQEINQRSLAALKGSGEGPAIKALKEGAQIPGALKSSGTGAAPYGVPGGSKNGTGIAGGGTGIGVGGGSATGLKGIPAAEFNNYFNQLKKRVESVWKFPDGVSGVQRVAVVFTLDRSGRLIKAEVLESSDGRLNTGAVEAMKKASPFPPIPDSLKEIANEPLRMQFTVTIGLRG
jgi:TonB family protein